MGRYPFPHVHLHAVDLPVRLDRRLSRETPACQDLFNRLPASLKAQTDTPGSPLRRQKILQRFIFYNLSPVDNQDPPRDLLDLGEDVGA